MSRFAWRMLFGGSILVAVVCGFLYGWNQRAENAPFVTVIKSEDPPESKLLRKGRYDEAVTAVLDSIKDEKKDYLKYQTVAAIYYSRAHHDPTNREKWAAQAATYVDKSVSLAPHDFLNLMEAASMFDRLGDSSSQGCADYEKAQRYAQDSSSELKGDSIVAGDEKMPSQLVRDAVEKLLKKIQGEMQSKCEGKPQTH
jgi:hypothetical protein